MKSYREKLRNPRWQRRRLEMMEVAGFACQHCGAEDKTLAVHHRRYFRGRDPWEYPDELLLVLCEDCHEAEHATRNMINDALAEMHLDDMCHLLGAAQGLIAIRLAMDGEQMDREFSFGGFEDIRASLGFLQQLPGVPEHSVVKIATSLTKGKNVISVGDVSAIFEQAERVAYDG